MRYARFFRNSPVTLAFLVLLGGFVANSGAGQESVGTLRAEPGEVTFRRMDSQAAIRVYLGAEQVAFDRIARASIDGPYGWMFSIVKPPDATASLLLKTKPHLVEAGSYSLIIEAGGQRTEVAIRATLESEINCIQAEAAERNEDIETVLRRRGLVTYSWREELAIALPGPYYEGAVLELALGGDPDRWYAWRVNEEVFLEGLGKSTLRLPLTEPGEWKLAVNVVKDNIPVAEWSGSFKVVPEPEQSLTVKVRRVLRIEGPAGYEAYQWKVDDRPVSEDRMLKHTFREPGRHRIECMATRPVDQPNRVYRRVIWDVTAE